METTNSTPIVIGTNNLQFNKIKAYYIELCDTMNGLWGSILNYLKIEEETPFDNELFNGLINAKDKIAFLNLEYIKVHNISIMGLDPIALAKSNLLNVDKSPFIEKDLIYFTTLIEKFETSHIEFVYPMASLLSKENNGFMLNDDFVKQALNYCSDKAITPDQQTIVQHVKQITEAMNGLVRMGAMRANTHEAWLNFVIDVDSSDKENPFKVERKLFNFHELKHFRSPHEYGGSVSDLFAE